MTDYSFTRGDSISIPFALGSDATGAVARFSLKEDPEDTNKDALAFKASYDAAEIAWTDLVKGKGTVLLRKPDTNTIDPAAYHYDVEVTRPGAENTPAEVGTVAVAAGATTIIGTGTAFKKLHVGDIIMLDSAHAENQKPVVVTEVVDDLNIDTDYSGWFTEIGVAIDVNDGVVKTVESGKITLKMDVTR